MAVTTGEVSVSMNDIAKTMSITIRVKGVSVFQFRMWLTMQLLKLAAMTAPVSTFLEVEGP